MRKECNLTRLTSVSLLEAVCAAREDAPELAGAVGRASMYVPVSEGGESDAPAGVEYARLVERSRIATDMYRALNDRHAEAPPDEIQRQVDLMLDTGDVSSFRNELGKATLSRYPMWATFPEAPATRALANPDASSVDWLRLGLRTNVPDRMVAMWYQLPSDERSYIPTICIANAGRTGDLNPCFWPADEGMRRGRTKRCSIIDALDDGLPEIVHGAVTGDAITALQVRSR